MTTATAPTSAHDYRHWYINHVRGLVPSDFSLIEMPAAHAASRRICKYLLEPAAPHALFHGFSVEWLDAAVARHFTGRSKSIYSDDESVSHDDQFWQVRQKRVLSGVAVKNSGWRGVVKISRGDDTLYWCEDEYCGGIEWTALHYAAFKHKAFLEEVLFLLLKARIEECTPSKRTVFCSNGTDFELEQVPLERVILPPDLKREIVTSTEAFFKCITAFTGIGVPSKRGFLLAGTPGNGKTLLCQALTSHIVEQYKVRVGTLQINNELSNDGLAELYEWGAQHAPCLILLEDIDTLVSQTMVTRSGFLNVLDGLKPKRGVLTLATTNYPENLDPALSDRPSRFDRVWRIPSPGDEQRRQFLQLLFNTAAFDPALYDELVSRTRGWSMAYVQELKATAVVNAMQHERDHLSPEDVRYALDVLAKQVRSAKKQHQKDDPNTELGFAA
jgi:hypothetical protein